MDSQKRIRDFAKLLRELNSLYMQDEDRQESPYSHLSKQELFAIDFLGSSYTCRMGVIAQRLGVGQSAVTALVDKLETQKLVRRIRSERDRRVWLVELTTPGKAVYASQKKAYLSLASHMLEPLSETERETLIELMRRIANAVGEGEKVKR